MSNTPSILGATLDQIEFLYGKAMIEPGRLWKIGLKPGWITVVGDRGECGTAFRFSDHSDKGLPAAGISYGDDLVSSEELKGLIGKELLEVARGNLSSSLIPRRSVAVAALSALSQCFLSEESLVSRGYRVRGDRDVLGEIIHPDDVVTLIGYGGMVENLVGRCRELQVADMRPAQSLRTTVIGETVEYSPGVVTFHGPDEDYAILARSDVAMITASSLVNGTVEDLLRYAQKARVVGLYGPSASIIPDVLFEHRVDFIMSHHVSDPDRFVHSLTTDGNMELAIRNHQRYQTIAKG